MCSPMGCESTYNFLISMSSKNCRKNDETHHLYILPRISGRIPGYLTVQSAGLPPVCSKQLASDVKPAPLRTPCCNEDGCATSLERRQPRSFVTTSCSGKSLRVCSSSQLFRIPSFGSGQWMGHTPPLQPIDHTSMA